jgi:hypothetical protein
MKLNEIKETGQKIEQGAWVEDLPNLPGVAIKARGTFNSDYNRLLQKLRSKLSQADLLNDEVNNEIETHLLLDTILLDWSGIDDAQYSKVLAGKLLRDPDMVILRRAVVYAGNVVAREGKDRTEDATKN